VPHLLVVEDDVALRGVLARGLREQGFQVTTAADGASALRAATAGQDAVILDVGLPDSDGRDVCQALRARGVRAPVLFLTAHDRLNDRLAGFASGGDDYLAKPFHFAEVVARVRALLKRPATESAPADLLLDPATHSLVGPATTAPLTPTEFRLLAALAAVPGAVVRRREMVRAAWPDGARVHENTLDQYVARLRRKLRDVESEHTIETAHGVGYSLR